MLGSAVADSRMIEAWCPSLLGCKSKGVIGTLKGLQTDLEMLSWYRQDSEGALVWSWLQRM